MPRCLVTSSNRISSAQPFHCNTVSGPQALFTRRLISFDPVLEGGLGAWGTTLVGIFAEAVFGVGTLPDPTSEASMRAFQIAKLEGNMDEWLRGIAMAVLCVTLLPWFIAFLFFFPMYRYYPRESRHLNLPACQEIRDDEESSQS